MAILLCWTPQKLLSILLYVKAFFGLIFGLIFQLLTELIMYKFLITILKVCNTNNNNNNNNNIFSRVIFTAIF